MSDQMLYNLAEDLLNRNISAGRGNKTAFIDANGSYSYADVAQRANRAANATGGNVEILRTPSNETHSALTRKPREFSQFNA